MPGPSFYSGILREDFWKLATGKNAARPRRLVSLGRQGIGHVGLKVSNLERSRSFYRDVLGLLGETRKSGTILLHSGSDVLVLYEEGSRGSDFHFGFRLDLSSQVEEWKNWLKKNHVPIHEDIIEEGHPRSFKFKDPDGHWIEIAAQPLDCKTKKPH